MRRGRHAKRRLFLRGWLSVVIACVLGLVLATGGAAYAAYRYDLSSTDRVLPGVSISGIDVGEMTREEAIRAVGAWAERELFRDLTVRAEEVEWHLTPAELGVRADVEGAVERAFAIASAYSWPSRVFHRLTDRPVGLSLDVAFSYDRSPVEAFVERAARQVFRPLRNARLELVDGELGMQRSVVGRVLKLLPNVDLLGAAVERGDTLIDLPVTPLEPEVVEKDLGRTIVIRLSENRLYLYKGLWLSRTYPVATGSPGFPTPPGSFEIVDKNENPSWTNPDPEGWGKDLPAYIPPGPGNPLGTRAMYLNAPGIRIHGTYDLGSIGTYASHGCIRMSIADSEAMYEIVDVGTPVLILW